MAKNDEQQNTKDNHISFAKRLKRWFMWLILAAIAAGGFYVAYLENRLPWLNAPQAIEEQKQPAPLQTSDTAILADKIAVLEGQVRILNNKIIALQNATPADSMELVKNIDSRLAQIEQANNEAIAQIMAQVAAEKGETPQANKPASRDVLLASGALIVRDMAEQGLPFAYEAEVLQILAQGNPQAEQYAATAQQFAASGLKGAPALIREFNKLYATLNDQPTVNTTTTEITITDEPQTWYAKTWQWFKNIAVHRKKTAKPEFNANEDEVYQLVNAAHFAEALNVLKTDSQYTRIDAPALAEWQKQASAYVAFDTAMRGLIMNALANIRLQEMQH